MEGWQYELDHIERPERVLTGTGRGVLSRREDIDGTSICLVGSLYTKEMQLDSFQSQIQVLDSNSQVWGPDTKIGTGGERVRPSKWYSLWWEAICKEMKNVRPAFEVWEKDISQIPPGYQQIKCHMVFDVKMGENFRRKA